MGPLIHLVRHAQLIRSKAVHNLTVLNHGMHDPALTPHGENQCHELQSKFPYHESIDLLVCSPLQRTVQTTLLAFEPELSRGVQCIALPEVQETSDLPCDTGSNVATLREKFKNKPVDLSLLSEDWDSKTGRWAPQQEAIERRCRDARKWLKTRDGKAIVVVTHGGLLHYLTEDWTGCEVVPGTGWENTEFRSYRFVDGDDQNASIEETAESRQRRGNEDKPLTKEEKTQMRETVTTT
ncbi:MAG: hypothetical protein L6R36_000114 [Xanthoria steineri]|nr:MAG: hypothetical protein L6R36_000114 [Xanthoria steineri]